MARDGGGVTRGTVALALAGLVTLATVARAAEPACLSVEEVLVLAPGVVKAGHMENDKCATVKQIATWKEEDRHARALAKLGRLGRD
jgi:hypothetical protein